MSWNGSTGRTNLPSTQQRTSFGVSPRTAIIALFLCALVGGGIWLSHRLINTNEPKLTANRPAQGGISVVQNIVDGLTIKPPKKPIKKSTHKLSVAIAEQFQGQDLKDAQALQDALDSDDFQATRLAALKALKSANPELRMNAVDALSWFGFKALPELTACMADADEDVRQAAENAWEMGAQEIEDSTDRFKVVSATMGVLTDADQLTSLGGLLSNAASEMIDEPDDESVSAKRRQSVVQTLVDMIGGKNASLTEAAKEAYENITGNEWRGIDEAERYLRDPDNYEAPAE